MHPLHQRFIAVSLLASIAISGFAPAAFAGHGHDSYRKSRRFERPERFERVNVYPQRVVEYRHRSSGGGSMAGFLGGVAVGAIISGAAQSHGSSRAACAPQPAYYPPQPTYCPPPPRCAADEERYSYEDPYCRERFSSLSLFLSHARRYGDHVLVVQVIDNRDENCVDVIRYRDDHWVSCDRNDRGGWDYDDND